MILEMVYFRFRLDEADPNRMSAAAQEHVRLLERMNKTDIPGSVKILRLHVQEARDHIISCLSKSEQPRDFLFDAI
jgi:DNA-binding GntR family transcriptional regulator